MASRQKNYDYPEKTKGAKIGEEIRAKTNHLTNVQRERLLNQAMVMIYGGDKGSGKAVSSRH